MQRERVSRASPQIDRRENIQATGLSVARGRWPRPYDLGAISGNVIPPCDGSDHSTPYPMWEHLRTCLAEPTDTIG